MSFFLICLIGGLIIIGRAGDALGIAIYGFGFAVYGGAKFTTTGVIGVTKTTKRTICPKWIVATKGAISTAHAAKLRGINAAHAARNHLHELFGVFGGVIFGKRFKFILYRGQQYQHGDYVT